MIGEVCDYLNNYFVLKNSDMIIGSFTISNGALTSDSGGNILQNNRYYRIIGSVFNDGVYKHGTETLINESFEGAVWLMALPADFINLVTEIELWQAKYGGTDSPATSPYNSESFGGYSYTKSAITGGDGATSAAPTWKDVYKARLARWRKI